MLNEIHPCRSDCDPELIVNVQFSQLVKIHHLVIRPKKDRTPRPAAHLTRNGLRAAGA